jgi:cellulose synthase operon protein C
MLRIRYSIIFVVVFLLVFASGCNVALKYKLGRAQKLESEGKSAEAIQLYSNLLTRMPAQGRERSMVLLHIGECWLRLESPSDAFAAFQKATEADPKNMTAQLRLGEMYLAGGAAERASEQAQKVLQLASANIDGLALLGAASSAAGDTDLARQAFEGVLKAEPQRVRVAVALADIYNQRNQVEKARQVLTSAISAQPSSYVPLLALGRLEEQEGNSTAAEDAYRRAVGVQDSVETNTRLATFLARTSRPDEATKVLAHADSLNDELPVGGADFKLLAGDPTLALDQYEAVLDSPSLEKASGGSWMSRHSSRSGSARTDETRARLAVRVIEADLDLAAKQAQSDPSMLPATAAAKLHFAQYRDDLDPATSQVVQAEMALAERDLPAATVFAQKAVTLAPESAAALYVRGLVEYRNGAQGKARSDWLRALDADQNHVPTRLALALDAFDSGDFSGAEGYVVPVVRDEPENVRALNLFARVLLGENRYNSAELIAGRSIVINDANAAPHLVLAKIAALQDRFATALTAYERALTLEPRSEEAMQGMIALYSQGHLTRQMLGKLEHVAGTAPASAPLMELSGRIYEQRGWTEDAKRCLKRSLEIDPYRVTAVSELAKFTAESGDIDAALKIGAGKGGPDAALLKALRAERQQDGTTAIKQYEAALREGEPSGIAANNLAWMLAVKRSNLQRALELAEKARSLSPDSPAVLDTLGFVHLQRREYSAAIPVLREAAELAQRKGATAEQDAIHRHLDQAYEESGGRVSAPSSH